MSTSNGEEPASAAQQERRERILAATIALASRGGFDAVQMRAVAERSDVALGTLYRYFPSKIHLLVCALAGEFERVEDRFCRTAVPGESAPQRVMYVLARTTRSLQRDPALTEALTRAFMFADGSVTAQIDTVGMHVVRLLTHAMHDQGHSRAEPTADDIAIAKVIGDVWLSGLMQWVTGRSSAAEVVGSLDLAVRLLLR